MDWLLSFFFFNATSTTQLYTLSLHDALPIFVDQQLRPPLDQRLQLLAAEGGAEDRKSTRLNSSHRCISYAVFCLKKKTTQTTRGILTTLNRVLVRKLL